MTDQSEHSQQGGPPEDHGPKLGEAIARSAKAASAAKTDWTPQLHPNKPPFVNYAGLVKTEKEGGTSPPFPDHAGLMFRSEAKGGASTPGSSSQKPRGEIPPSRKREVGLLHED